MHVNKLPLYLWAEAMVTIIYVKNRIDTEVVEGLTVYEKWYSEKLFIAHLCIFISDCYIYIPKDQRINGR